MLASRPRGFVFKLSRLSGVNKLASCGLLALREHLVTLVTIPMEPSLKEMRGSNISKHPDSHFSPPTTLKVPKDQLVQGLFIFINQRTDPSNSRSTLTLAVSFPKKFVQIPSKILLGPEPGNTCSSSLQLLDPVLKQFWQEKTASNF